MDHNMLKELPIGLFSLPNLQVFCASENKLELDANMSVTSPLGEVDLSTNRIQTLPDALLCCTTITSLSLSFVFYPNEMAHSVRSSIFNLFLFF